MRGDTGYVAGGASVGRFHVTDLHVQIRRLPKPVVAMVAGYAIGGGHVLHLVCDLTIAADNARFGQIGPKVGSFDGGYGAVAAGRLVGPKKAKEFWLLCRQYDAQQALEMGLVNTVVPLERLEEETVQWCREMLALSPFALRLVKASFHAHEDGFAGIQQLAHDANLLFYAQRGGRRRGARPTRRSAPPTSRRSRAGRERASDRRAPERRADLADGRAAAHAARRGGAGAGRHRAGGDRGHVQGRSRSSRRCSARCSSRSGRTSRTTTPTRAAAPTPRTGWGRCG